MATTAASPPTAWPRELLASVVVFLVALPLCMGISIACGVNPALGLVTGIIGGLVVGVLAGSPLQVSGPAAGLIVLVVDIIAYGGLEALGFAVFVGGLLQLATGSLGLGRVFRAVSPSVIQGMLAGIGVLIFASQFHVMLDDKPKASGLENLETIPVAIFDGFFPIDGSPHHMAAFTGALTIVSLLAWERFRPKALKAVPGALVGVMMGAGAANLLAFDISFVTVPESLGADLTLVGAHWLDLVTDARLWGEAVGLAVIASAESLLCASAVDQIHTGPRTDYDKELRAQGIGNLICGMLGVLPMTGVIVRSSANVQAGAKTRWSAVLHGVWLLALVALLPFVLEVIPTSSLAAILVYTGYKLANPRKVFQLAAYGKGEVAVFLMTVSVIVATDLLTGVVAGVVLATGHLVFHSCRLYLDTSIEDEVQVVTFEGVASFFSIPALARTLDALPAGSQVRFDTEHLVYLDQGCLEILHSWKRSHEASGGILLTELGGLDAHPMARLAKGGGTIRLSKRLDGTEAA